MIAYLISIDLVKFAFTKQEQPILKTELTTSAPSRAINDWLTENKLPRLSSWNYDGQSGTNAPGPHRGVLHVLYLKCSAHGSERLIITTHELVPVDPTTLL
jgi:hypothetical protein